MEDGNRWKVESQGEGKDMSVGRRKEWSEDGNDGRDRRRLEMEGEWEGREKGRTQVWEEKRNRVKKEERDGGKWEGKTEKKGGWEGRLEDRKGRGTDKHVGRKALFKVYQKITYFPYFVFCSDIFVLKL